MSSTSALMSTDLSTVLDTMRTLDQFYKKMLSRGVKAVNDARRVYSASWRGLPIFQEGRQYSSLNEASYLQRVADKPCDPSDYGYRSVCTDRRFSSQAGRNSKQSTIIDNIGVASRSIFDEYVFIMSSPSAVTSQQCNSPKKPDGIRLNAWSPSLPDDLDAFASEESSLEDTTGRNG